MNLIISKDKGEIRRLLGLLMLDDKIPTIIFYPENFSSDKFFQEVETLPFLSQKKAVIVYELDQLSQEDIEIISIYVEKPNAWISLYLTAAELPFQSKLVKLVEKNGKIFSFKEEKPWEKEKRLAEWLVEEAKKQSVHFPLQAAIALVQSVNHQMLKMELDKLICFVDSKKEISIDDISLICEPIHHETLWQLGDAIFNHETTRALEICKVLLNEGVAIFLLLSNLRTQFMSGLEMLSSGGDVAKKFPYLKGNLLQKKIQTFKKYGKTSLNQGLLFIFESEVKVKNSSIDPTLLLELLIIKLCNDTLSASQFVRANC